MKRENPNLGDIVMLMTPTYTEVPLPPRRGRPSKKNPNNIRTETTWNDDVEAIIVSGPFQGVSSDGEDYWLEWTAQRLDNGMLRIITIGRNQFNDHWRFVSR